MRAWWAEFFWSRTHKSEAAFRRGFALGVVAGLVLTAMALKLDG